MIVVLKLSQCYVLIVIIASIFKNGTSTNRTFVLCFHLRRNWLVTTYFFWWNRKKSTKDFRMDQRNSPKSNIWAIFIDATIWFWMIMVITWVIWAIKIRELPPEISYSPILKMFFAEKSFENTVVGTILEWLFPIICLYARLSFQIQYEQFYSLGVNLNFVHIR